MKESKAKKKMCPKLFAAAVIAQASSHVPVSTETLEEMSYCRGSKCAMWEADQKSESNKFKKNNVPKGWEIIGSESQGNISICQRIAVLDSGNCGLKTKELYCEGCN